MKYVDLFANKTSWNSEECSNAANFLKLETEYSELDIGFLMIMAEKTKISYQTWLQLSKCVD